MPELVNVTQPGCVHSRYTPYAAEDFKLRQCRIAYGLLLAVSVAICGASVYAVDLTGRPSVIDGDTIEIHGRRIRLHGIDAPEASQTCSIGGRQYRCGQEAALALADHIGQRPVACEQRDIDRYGRVVALCRVGREDIGAWLVSQGWALAYARYSRDYIDQEIIARAGKRGMWRGTFMPPWAWRGRGADASTDAAQNQSSLCAALASEI
jgi:endonuclease YncB( thermonuclease family)